MLAMFLLGYFVGGVIVVLLCALCRKEDRYDDLEQQGGVYISFAVIDEEIDASCSGCRFISIEETEEVYDISYMIKCDRSSTAPCYKDEQ